MKFFILLSVCLSFGSDAGTIGAVWYGYNEILTCRLLQVPGFQ